MNSNKELIKTLKKTLEALEQKEKKKSLGQRVRELEEEVERLKENEHNYSEVVDYVYINRRTGFVPRTRLKKDPPWNAKLMNENNACVRQLIRGRVFLKEKPILKDRDGLKIEAVLNEVGNYCLSQIPKDRNYCLIWKVRGDKDSINLIPKEKIIKRGNNHAILFEDISGTQTGLVDTYANTYLVNDVFDFG